MLSNCFVVAFNHHFLKVEERSLLFLDTKQQEELFSLAKKNGIDSLVILCTCNRSELYGLGDYKIIEQLLYEVLDIPSYIQDKKIIKIGPDAVEHIFNVASGLDSKIIGDLEIFGQIKSAFNFSKENKMLNGFFERLSNTCIQAIKEVRNTTKLSEGTISLSYSIVKILKEKATPISANILLIGTGEFGEEIVKNICTYLPDNPFYICNRTDSKSIEVSEKFKINSIKFENLKQEIQNFDIIITAISNANSYTIIKEDAANWNGKILFDMSVPQAIDPQLQTLKNIELISLDDASAIINKTLENRKGDLPIANEILQKYLNDFFQWAIHYSNSNFLKTWKKMLIKTNDNCPVYSLFGELEKQKLIKRNMAEFSFFLKETNHYPKESKFLITQFCEVNGIPINPKILNNVALVDKIV